MNLKRISNRLLQISLTAACVLLCSVMAFGQTGFAGIPARFDQYRKRALQEKIYVHTDKSFYLAGEVMWFKLYYVDGTFHKPLDLSKVGYVELLDKDNKPVMQGKIALKEGHGEGSFFLPTSVASGTYRLRAYTNWMKNFGPEYFFQQPVQIANTLKVQPATRHDTTLRYDVQFLPEGGHLVKGIESKVAFRVTDQYGKGLDFRGALLNEQRDTILYFQPHRFGMGHFVVAPQSTQPYKAVVQLPNGETIYRDLPAVQEHGYVLRVTDADLQHIEATVTGSMPGDEDVLLFVHTRQAVKIAEKKTLANGSAQFTIRKDQLGDGISHFTVFDNRRQPVCERLYFKMPRHRLSITAGSDAAVYDTRSKVTLNIQSKDGSKGVPAALSLSVFRADSLQNHTGQDILSYLWLSSDLRGTIESPEYYFSANTPEVREALDNLMLVHGWRRFNWTSLLSTRETVYEHAPEFDGHIISGKVVAASNGNPVSDVQSYLSVPGYPVRFFSAPTDGEGIVRFDVRDYYGPGEVVLQTDIRHVVNSYRIEAINPFLERYTTTPLPPLRLTPGTAPYLRQHNLGMQVHNTFASEMISRFAVPSVDTLAFYGVPFKRYRLDDYVRFTTMEEVLREYVPEVAVRRYGGQLHLWVFYFREDRFFASDPLILLDGVPVTHEEIMQYDPLKVKFLEVVTEKYVNGEYTYEGIVSFTTYHGEMEDFKLNAKSVHLDYEGLQLKREFYAPVYNSESERASRLPDFRNVLYWSPDIQTDAHGDAQAPFFTSDIKGKYVAVLQGLDREGRAGSYSFMFEVK